MPTAYNQSWKIDEDCMQEVDGWGTEEVAGAKEEVEP